MNRATAEQMMNLLLALDKPLNGITALTEGIADRDEQRSVRKIVGELVDLAYVGLMLPIIRQFPDLDPTRATARDG